MKKVYILLLLMPLMLVASAQKPGTLDSSFGKNGAVIDSVAARFNSGVVQANQKIIGGSSVLRRCQKNGAPDSRYGNNGSAYFQEPFLDIVLQPDGKQVVLSGNSTFTLARFKTDGTPDSSFGTNGIVSSAKKFDSEEPSKLAIEPDGTIVACGTFYHYTSGENYESSFGVRRYIKNGNPDYKFGDSGLATFKFPPTLNTCTAVVCQQDGKIILGGKYNDLPNREEFALLRYKTNGTPDSSFGKNGTAVYPFTSGGDYLQSLALQANGQIVAAGMYKNNVKEYMSAARYNANGSIDKTFGQSGYVYIDFPTAYSRASNVLIQSNGKIIITGTCTPVKYDPVKSSAYGLARLTYNGALDNTFGTGGRVAGLDFINTYVSGSALQADGKIVVFGFYIPADNTIKSYGLITRYYGDAVAANGTNTNDEALKKMPAFTIKISPNPARDVIKVSGLPAHEKSVINITDRSGNILQTVSATSSSVNINIARLHSGLYHLQVISNRAMETSEFIKE